MRSKRKTRWVRGAALLLLVPWLSATALATTWYIDPVGGNDTWDGKAATDQGGGVGPWKTFADINAGTTTPAIAGGDVINVADGTIDDVQLKPVDSGTSVAVPVTIQATNGCTGGVAQPKTCSVTMDGSGTTAVNGIDLSVVDFWKVVGLRLTGFTKNGVNFGQKDGHHLENMRIDNNATDSANQGVYGDGANDDITITDCQIDFNGKAANEADGGGGNAIQLKTNVAVPDNILIQDLLLHDNIEDALKFSNVTNLIVERCKLYSAINEWDVHTDGLVIKQCDGVIVRYCEFRDISQLIYFAFDNSANWTSTNVKIYGNTFFNWDYAADVGNTLAAINVHLRVATQTASNFEIHSNTFGYCGLLAIHVHENVAGATMDNVDYYNNCFRYVKDNTSATAVDTTDVTNVTHDYNSYWNCVVDGSETNEVTANPLLVNPNYPGGPGAIDVDTFDFRVTNPSSPLIDAGHPTLGSVVTLPSPWVDRDGVTRDATSGEIGAFVYVASMTDLTAIERAYPRGVLRGKRAVP